MDEYMNEQEQWEFVRNWVRQNALWVVAGVALTSKFVGWAAMSIASPFATAPRSRTSGRSSVIVFRSGLTRTSR